MFKKVVSLFICFVAAFTLTVSAFAQSGGADVEAASSVPLYLKYYYDQIGTDAQKAFLKIRKGIINHDKKVTFGKEIDRISEDELQKIVELLIFHDPLSFNFDIFEEDPKDPYSLILTYKFKKETYDKMIAAYDKKVDNILAKLTDNMSTYKKIKTIHDSIINTATYDLEPTYSGSIYGTLVKKRARCVGYAHTFSYICSKAGIRTVSVIGYGYPQTDDEMHMWNKVYYNKKWYNVDTTWDDPVNNLKKNLTYDYFMISDKSMSRDHEESNYSFKTPAAKDSSKDYYMTNKLYAEDLDSAKKIIKNGITTAAKNNNPVFTFKCSSKSVFNKVDAYLGGQDIFKVFSSVKKNTNKNLVDVTFYYFENNGQYTITIQLFYKNTSLDKYYSDTSQVSNDTKSTLKKYGIK